VPPNAAHDAGYLARRLRRQLPDIKIVIGLWGSEEKNAALASASSSSRRRSR